VGEEKISRRAVLRAGEQAAQAVVEQRSLLMETDQAVKDLGRVMQDTRNQVSDLADDNAALWRELEDLKKWRKEEITRQQVDVLMSATLWRRLRWLIQG
jgi:regulator of replication initiation timing